MSFFSNTSKLSPRLSKAVGQLSEAISLQSILEYAQGLHEPHELKFIKMMIFDLSLRSHCREADVAECIHYVDTLIDDCYRPRVIEQYNTGCQQFYGPIQRSEFHIK